MTPASTDCTNGQKRSVLVLYLSNDKTTALACSSLAIRTIGAHHKVLLRAVRRRSYQGTVAPHATSAYCLPLPDDVPDVIDAIQCLLIWPFSPQRKHALS